MKILDMVAKNLKVIFGYNAKKVYKNHNSKNHKYRRLVLFIQKLFFKNLLGVILLTFLYYLI